MRIFESLKHHSSAIYLVKQVSAHRTSKFRRFLFLSVADILTNTMVGTSSCVTVEKMSHEQQTASSPHPAIGEERPGLSLDDECQPYIIESCLLSDNFSQVMHDLLAFESRIERRFSTINAVYRYTCGRVNCLFKCGVPHLTLIIRVQGRTDDQIGIMLQNERTLIRNILPRVPNGQYTFRTWRNSRWHIINRMLLCLCIHYRTLSGKNQRPAQEKGFVLGSTSVKKTTMASLWQGCRTNPHGVQLSSICRGMQHIEGLVLKPLYVYILGGITGRLLNVQKRLSGSWRLAVPEEDLARLLEKDVTD